MEAGKREKKSERGNMRRGKEKWAWKHAKGKRIRRIK